MTNETLLELRDITDFIEARLKECKEVSEREEWLIRQTDNFSGLKELGVEQGKSEAYVVLLKEFKRIAIADEKESNKDLEDLMNKKMMDDVLNELSAPTLEEEMGFAAFESLQALEEYLNNKEKVEIEPENIEIELVAPSSPTKWEKLKKFMRFGW